MALFPMFLRLEGKRCLIVGAGTVAREKIESLLRCGAQLLVVAPDAVPAVTELSRAGRIEWVQRAFLPQDLDGVCLAIAATNDREINRTVFEEAGRRSILTNTVDDPPLCDFFCASIVERGDLQLAISTAGKSPALAQRLRREIDAQLEADLGRWLDDLGALRREILEAAPPSEARKLLLHRLAAREVCRAESCPAKQEAFASARELAGQSSKAEEATR